MGLEGPAAHSSTGGGESRQGVGEHKYRDIGNGRHHYRHAWSAIARKIETFSGGATPPVESFLGFVVHIIGEDGDDETV